MVALPVGFLLLSLSVARSREEDEDKAILHWLCRSFTLTLPPPDFSALPQPEGDISTWATFWGNIPVEGGAMAPSGWSKVRTAQAGSKRGQVLDRGQFK